MPGRTKAKTRDGAGGRAAQTQALGAEEQIMTAPAMIGHGAGGLSGML